MMSFSWYQYTTDGGNKYDLGCEYMISQRRIHLVGCDMYNEMGEYVGYWDRSNIPVWLVYELERWLKGDANSGPAQMRLGVR